MSAVPHSSEQLKQGREEEEDGMITAED